LESIRPLDQALSRLTSDLDGLEFLEQGCSTSNDHKGSSEPYGGIKKDVTCCYSANYSPASHCSMNTRKKRIANHNHSYPTRTKPLPPTNVSVVSAIESLDVLVVPLSLKHASWVILQSIPRVSPSLHIKIKKIAADLQLSETQHSELNNKYIALQEKFGSSPLCTANESGVKMKSGLDDKDCYKIIVDQIMYALSKTSIELDKHFNRSSNPSATEQNDRNNIESAHLNRFTLRESAAPAPSRFKGNSLNRSLDADVILQVGTKTNTENVVSFQDGIDYGDRELNQTIEDSPPNLRFEYNIDPYLVPGMVNQAISMGILAKNTLSDAEHRLHSIEFDLQKTQSALRLSKMEYEQLAREIERSILCDENRKNAFIEIECVLRRDLESATDLAESQNLLVVTLSAKVMLYVCYIFMNALIVMLHENTNVFSY
jgi:hypothetical protein